MNETNINNEFIKIRNATLESIFNSGLSGVEISCWLFIYRKTIGWKKLEDEISLSQFTKSVPYSKPTIVKALKILQLVNMTQLVKSGKSTKCSNLWRIIENSREWKLVKLTQLVKSRKRTSKVLSNKLVKPTQHTKDNTKETIQKTLTTSGAQPKKKDERIDIFLASVKKHTGLPAVSGKKSRQYAYLLLNALRKEYPDKPENELADSIVRAAVGLQDGWHSTKANDPTHLFYHWQEIILKTKTPQKKLNPIADFSQT